MTNKEAAKYCLGLNSLNIRILIDHFVFKRFRVSVIVVYTPVEPTDEYTRQIIILFSDTGAKRQGIRSKFDVFTWRF